MRTEIALEIIGVMAVLPVLAIVTVGLRLWIRRTKSQAPAADDFLILTALVRIICTKPKSGTESTRLSWSVDQ